MAKRMGQLPLQDDAPDAFDDRFSAMGFVSRNARSVTFEYVLFIDPFAGAPAMVQWLQSKGGGEFRYEISSENETEDESPAAPRQQK